MLATPPENTRPIDLEVPAENPMAALAKADARYHQSDIAMVVAAAHPPADLFSVGTMQQVREAVDKIDQLRVCKKVVQFLDVTAPVIERDQTVVQALVPELPNNDQDAAAIRQRVLSNPTANGQLIAPDGASALIVCPLTRPAAGEQLDLWVSSYANPKLQLTIGGARGIDAMLARELRRNAVILANCAVVGLIAAIFLQRTRGRMPTSLGWGIVAVACGVLALRFVTSGSPTNFLMGGGVARLQQSISNIMGINDLLYFDVASDTNKATGLKAMQRFCSNLAQRSHAAVSCPSDVLQQGAAALTGEDALPDTDAQLSTLWFLIGDMQELALLFTPDRQHALVSVRVQPGALSPTDIAVIANEVAAQEHVGVETFGLPLVQHWLRGILAIIAAAAALGFGAAYFLARKHGAQVAPLGAAWLVASALSPVGAVGLALALPGLWLMGASLGAAVAAPDDRQGGADKQNS